MPGYCNQEQNPSVMPVEESDGRISSIVGVALFFYVIIVCWRDWWHFFLPFRCYIKLHDSTLKAAAEGQEAAVAGLPAAERKTKRGTETELL